MKFNNLFRKAATVTVATTLLLGGGFQAFAKEKDSGDLEDDSRFTQITRHDMLNIFKQQGKEKFEVPSFDASTIKNIPSAKGRDGSGKLIDFDVWDSWPLQNADGTIANYKGYNIVFGLAGDPKRAEDTFIYLFYQKAGNTSLEGWKNAGRVFKDNDKILSNDAILKDQAEEWSGSATLTSDGEVRLFYTSRQPYEPENKLYGKQTLATAQINLSQPDEESLKVDGVEDLKSIYDGGDGKIYQNVQQSVGVSLDNHTFRDPHYIEDQGKKYIIFEANTGTETGYQGEDSLQKSAYYGGNNEFFTKELQNLLQSPKKNGAEMANGALGIVELNNDYTLKKVMDPLIASNLVTDEIERANVFKMNGLWYMFTSTRGSKVTVDAIGSDEIYMLGYVSTSLTGPYKPLNGTGLVLHQNLDRDDITWTYAHFAIPQGKGNNVVVTSYMTNRGLFPDHKSTFAPSFLLNIKGTKTSVVKNRILEQGQITIDPTDDKEVPPYDYGKK
ncbi:glycoside hydrolase family 68 protein [Paenibacillus sp. 8b26]|uniref:glycoside hydrolase family 68 protein n=1 Tax=Paenibacillus sp. 8b26 TaxID=3424133 RepID=UPI003D6532DC